jgi:hypothetical protein
VFAALVHLQSPIWTWRDFGPWGLLLVAALLFQMFCLFGWFAAVESLLRSVGDPHLKPDREFFRFALVYPVIYMPIFFPLSISHILQSNLFLVPLHLVWMVCVVYVIAYVAKSFVLVEKNGPVSSYEYIAPFVLLWFFPIGIWIFQPRVNQLYREDAHQHSTQLTTGPD